MNKIVILYNLNRNQFEYEAEFDSELTINSIYNVLHSRYEVYLLEADIDFKWISKLNDMHPDLVFNICEGFFGPARECVYGAILEQLHYNYTGPDSTNLLVCHNKTMVKKILSNQILVPFGYSISKPNDINSISTIQFPVIVKLNSEGSSIGLNKKSIVWNKDELIAQVQWLYKSYNSNMLVEEYISGQDISMIYIEGLGAMGPCIVECDSEFYDYDMKTIKDTDVNIYEAIGEYKELEKIVLRIAEMLDIRGYAKLDFRICNNKFYLIEVNSQVSFHPQGEFIICAKKKGYDFEMIINHIVSSALLRKRKANSFGIGGLNDEIII